LKKEVVPTEIIENRIFIIRGQRVMLDSDLAEIYCVTTKRFNEQFRRNIERFPSDFAFKLTSDEFEILRSQIATSRSHGGRRYLPYVFTEHGAIMAANVLNSKCAIEASINVVRAFVKLREMLETNKDLARKFKALEKKYDDQFRVVFDAIRALMTEEEKPKRKIGFKAKEKKTKYKTKILN
jgi:hypothetical protein